MPTKRKSWSGRVYLGADADRRERYDWVGRFPTKRERDAAVAARRAELQAGAATAALHRDDPGSVITCREYVDDTLRRMESGELRRKGGRAFKDSSIDQTRTALRRFVRDYGDRPLADVAGMRKGDARRWAERDDVTAGTVAVVVTLLNRAMEDDEYIDCNPFRGLGRRTVGRSKMAPPTENEFDRLLDGCVALGDYAGQMRNLLTFAANTGMRPGELFALEWADIDLAANRIHVGRRVYKGRLDLPKSNEERTIALPPPARDALLRQPTRTEALVFVSKHGRRLSQPTLSGYWSQVKAAAGLDFDFYLATKHYGVHLLYKLGLSRRAIAAQMGWAESAVDNLLGVYGHLDLVALGEVDALYERQVVALPAVSDATSDATAADSAS